MVDEDHPQLAAVVRVDQPGAVDARDPVPDREPGARQRRARRRPAAARSRRRSAPSRARPGAATNGSTQLRSYPASPARVRSRRPRGGMQELDFELVDGEIEGHRGKVASARRLASSPQVARSAVGSTTQPASATKCASAARITNAWKISWNPNTRGHGFGRPSAKITAPAVYSTPPAAISTSGATGSAARSCGNAITATQPERDVTGGAQHARRGDPGDAQRHAAQRARPDGDQHDPARRCPTAPAGRPACSEAAMKTKIVEWSIRRRIGRQRGFQRQR